MMKMSSEEDEQDSSNAVEKEEGDDGVQKNKSYEALAKENGMRYTLSDVPPLSVSILLGFQHYLTMLGATVLIPLLVTPAMGARIKGLES